MNTIAIFVSALAFFVVGFIFHVPPLGKVWMKLNNIQMPQNPPKLSSMWKQMALNYLGNLIVAYTMAGILSTATLAYGSMNWVTGAGASMFLWFGFVVATSVNDVIWMGRNKKAWGYEMFSMFVAFVVMGAILGGWR